VLEVEPGTIEKIPLERYSFVVSLGVADGTHRLRVERMARNYYLDPETGTGTPIDDAHPESHFVRTGLLPATITRPAAGFRVKLGGPASAGTYVCNDTLYRLCRKRPGAGYFIHLPNVANGEDDRLAAGLVHVVRRILASRLRTPRQ
jgi:pyrrolidone-carboxylate peptidase